MREIPDEVLDLIAGGYSASAEASMPVVYVHGSLPDLGGWGGDGWIGGGGDGPDPGSQSVSAPISVPDCIPEHSSPAPAAVPKDVDLNELRNTMLDVAAYIKTMDSSIEHGAFVVRSADGTLRVGEVKHGTTGQVDMSIYPLPGDVIVAYIHSHTDNDIDQKRPSIHDFEAAETLRGNPVVDKGMMLYILDNKSGDVFEYHADTPQNTNEAGANITDDTSQPCG